MLRARYDATFNNENPEDWMLQMIAGWLCQHLRTQKAREFGNLTRAIGRISNSVSEVNNLRGSSNICGSRSNVCPAPCSVAMLTQATVQWRVHAYDYFRCFLLLSFSWYFFPRVFSIVLRCRLTLEGLAHRVVHTALVVSLTVSS